MIINKKSKSFWPFLKIKETKRNLFIDLDMKNNFFFFGKRWYHVYN